jgi:hypothetical protein
MASRVKAWARKPRVSVGVMAMVWVCGGDGGGNARSVSRQCVLFQFLHSVVMLWVSTVVVAAAIVGVVMGVGVGVTAVLTLFLVIMLTVSVVLVVVVKGTSGMLASLPGVSDCDRWVKKVRFIARRGATKHYCSTLRGGSGVL